VSPGEGMGRQHWHPDTARNKGLQPRGHDSMAGAVSIENLRNIRRFGLPRFAERRVGCSLREMGPARPRCSALPEAFVTQCLPSALPMVAEIHQLDGLHAGSITYRVGNQEVQYAYRGGEVDASASANEQPICRRNSGIRTLSYIGATPERITPRPDDSYPPSCGAVQTW